VASTPYISLTAIYQAHVLYACVIKSKANCLEYFGYDVEIELWLNERFETVLKPRACAVWVTKKVNKKIVIHNQHSIMSKDF
jgi:hypothetical protein